MNRVIILKGKIKLIITFILGGIICSVISVSATLMYQANQVKYTKSNNEEVTLDSALNELYNDANTTIGDLNQNLSEIQNKYSQITMKYIVDSGHFISFVPTTVSNQYQKFNLTVLSSGSGATCNSFVANVTSKQYNIALSTDYLTANENFNEKRVYMEAVNNYCIFIVTYHN